MSKKNKYSFLLKNIGLLTISNFGSKILSFILIPLYTYLLTTTEYGTYDIYATTVSLMIPILTINIVEGVMRFSLDKDCNKNDIFSIGLKRVINAIIVFSILVLINKIIGIIRIFNEYYILFILLFSFELIYSLFSQFSRGLEKIKEVAIAGFINSISIVTFNIFFLLVIKSGLEGYFWANILGYILPSIYIFFKLKIWKYYENKKNKDLKKEINNYSRPLVFNTISWWINNVSDRYIVTWICGVAANGIYSIAYKIPSILNVFQSIFSQAWTLSAVKEYKNDNGEFYTNTYKVYNLALIIICSLLIALDKIIAKILFSKEFFIAWKYAPFLMISVLFGSLSGLLGGIFSAAKKSKDLARTTFLGAIVNTILNVLLVYFIGPIGAAISTMISYIIVWILRLIIANRISKLKISIKKDIICYSLLLFQSIVLILPILNSQYKYIIQIIIIAVLVLINYDDIKNINGLIRRRFHEKSN